MEEKEKICKLPDVALSTETPSSPRPRAILDGEIRQLFSLPENLIYYIAMNPSNAKVYQKLIRTCKYFYNINPILVVRELAYEEEGSDPLVSGWAVKAATATSQKSISKPKVKTIVLGHCKLWVTKCIYIIPYHKNCKNLAISIPKIFRCDADFVTLSHVDLILDDFLFLASKAGHCDITCNITERDGKTLVMFEKIVESLPKVQTLWWYRGYLECFTQNTVKELLKIPHFGNINDFILSAVPEVFDIKAFFDHIKKHKNMKVWLEYYGKSDEYKKQIHEIVDEILATEVYTYKPPFIGFDDDDSRLDEIKRKKMSEIHERYKNAQF